MVRSLLAEFVTSAFVLKMIKPYCTGVMGQSIFSLWLILLLMHLDCFRVSCLVFKETRLHLSTAMAPKLFLQLSGVGFFSMGELGLPNRAPCCFSGSESGESIEIRIASMCGVSMLSWFNWRVSMGSKWC